MPTLLFSSSGLDVRDKVPDEEDEVEGVFRKVLTS